MSGFTKRKPFAKVKHLAFWKNSNNYSSCFSYMRIYFNESSGLMNHFPFLHPKKVCCWHISTNCLLKPAKFKKHRPLPSPKEKHPTASPTVTSDDPVGLTSKGPKPIGRKPQVRAWWVYGHGTSELFEVMEDGGGERWWVRCGWVVGLVVVVVAAWGKK